MKKILNRLLSFFNTIKSKIAFYPTFMAIAGFGLAIAMMAVEAEGISNYLLEIVPMFTLSDGGTVISLLTVCIGGLISMMVFSFSMVMLLLSQASNNFSPRILPGLISDRRHQIILGVYLGSILYMIFTLLSIEKEDIGASLPQLSILLGILFTIFSFGAFINFIHTISQSIQISNILDRISNQALKRLNKIIETETASGSIAKSSFEEAEGWHSYSAGKSGYLQNISITNLVNLAIRNKLKIYITVPKGLFVLPEAELVKINQKVDEEIIQEIVSNISFSRDELIEDNYTLAFKQITEIVLKAMSPGINDPGTALNALDYLTELFALRMQKLDNDLFYDDGNPIVKHKTVDFEKLLTNIMSSLLTYCSKDPIVVQKMHWMLSYLVNRKAAKPNYHEVVKREFEKMNKLVKKLEKENA